MNLDLFPFEDCYEKCLPLLNEIDHLKKKYISLIEKNGKFEDFTIDDVQIHLAAIVANIADLKDQITHEVAAFLPLLTSEQMGEVGSSGGTVGDVKNVICSIHETKNLRSM